MTSPLTIDYQFRFPSGETKEISLSIDAETLTLLPVARPAPPEWTRLEVHQCPGCPLDPTRHSHCPSALQLSEIVTLFHEHNSFDQAEIEINDQRRRYLKETSLQEGLGSLIGIIMATGGCPVMEPLRPMVRYHLPFATMEETEFRMVSMYLMAQFLRQKNGELPDWSLEGLQTIYAKVKQVNFAFADRLRAASENDAGVNAIVILDCFAKAVPHAIKTYLRQRGD